MATVPRAMLFSPLLCLLFLALFSPVAAKGQLTANPANIAFLNVQVGTSSQGETLTNSGATSITISADSITGAGFTLSGLSLPKTLNAGESTSFSVTFAPTAAGAASGGISITFNGATLTIPLSGTCITQGNLVPNPASITFRNVQVVTSYQPVTLTNSGGTTVTISKAAISGLGFSLDGLAVPTTLNPGTSTSFTVDFASAGIDTGSGSLTITSDGLNPNLTIPLSGTVIHGTFTPDPPSISFTDIIFKSISDQKETLRNNSTGPVTISEASVSGTSFGLSVVPVPQTLEAGKSTSFQVKFKPASVGPASGTVTISSSNGKLSIPLSGRGVYSESQVKNLPECSLAKTNRNCKLIINREKPLSPPTIQMYSGQTITVIVKSPKPFERYFLDYQSGQANLSPDVASSVVQSLLPGLAKTAIHGALPVNDPCAVPEIAIPSNLPAPATVSAVLPTFQACLTKLQTDAIDIYHNLEPFVAPDSLTPNQSPRVADPTDVIADMSKFLVSEFALSSKITSISGSTALKSSLPDTPAITQLTDLQKAIDAVAADLLGYSQRIADLRTFNNGATKCANVINSMAGQCVSVSLGPDDESAYDSMVTRTITYALNAYNLVSYPQEAEPDTTKKKLLASIPMNFADSPSVKPSALRLEASAGVFFSTLAVRSFSVAPVFSGGMITDNIVAQNVLHPTAVPFAAANYRLTNDLGWTRWKSAIYWTGAVGVNPNTVSADFASGLSVSWRGLMFSPLWHYGHDVRLTQGFYVGEHLGSGFKASLPTQNYWTSSFALGLSIRVPSLTGR